MSTSDRTDPTTNVTTLVLTSVARLDDLRIAEQSRINELLKLHMEHAHDLRLAESKRIDAIRAVDVNAVVVANERAMAQATVLATQVATSAETLRALVASTAAAQAQQLTQLTAQLTDRIGTLEKSQYERKGSGLGMRDLYAWVIAAAMVVVNIGGVLYTIYHK